MRHAAPIVPTVSTADRSRATQWDASVAWKLCAGGFALMLVAAVLLWWHFGATIFFDVLASVQGCF